MYSIKSAALTERRNYIIAVYVSCTQTYLCFIGIHVLVIDNIAYLGEITTYK